MNDFNELQVTNEYLVDELTIARQTNEKLSEVNRKLEQLLTGAIKDLEDASKLLNLLSKSVDDLTNLVTKHFVFKL